MRRTVVLSVPGLTFRLMSARLPGLAAWARKGAVTAVEGMLPAVGDAVGVTYLTGVPPERHGVVGSTWYVREEGELRAWRQSARLVQSPRLWDAARLLEPRFTCASLFWPYSVFASSDYTLASRPHRSLTGRWGVDLFASPPGLRQELEARVGPFPASAFWGPTAGFRASLWVAEAARRLAARYSPTLLMAQLPSLSFALQRYAAEDSRLDDELGAFDPLCTDLIESLEDDGWQVVLLSEYGIQPVTRAVELNRALRRQGLLAVREEEGREVLDPGASSAFALADHQVAQVYVQDTGRTRQVRTLLEQLPGVERILDETERRTAGLAHPRGGDLLAVARPDAWFSGAFWLEDRKAPPFARSVEGQLKAGCDPLELFYDPALRLLPLRLASRFIKQRLGFHAPLDFLPSDPSLVKGSYGRPAEVPEEGPLLVTRRSDLVDSRSLAPTAVHGLLLAHLTGRRPTVSSEPPTASEGWILS